VGCVVKAWKLIITRSVNFECQQTITNNRGKLACHKTLAVVYFCPSNRNDKVTFEKQTVDVLMLFEGLCSK